MGFKMEFLKNLDILFRNVFIWIQQTFVIGTTCNKRRIQFNNTSDISLFNQVEQGRKERIMKNKILIEITQWTDELEIGWQRYAESHFIPPKNFNSERLIDQLVSVIPMSHNRETFRNELFCNPNFYKKWMLNLINL